MTTFSPLQDPVDSVFATVRGKEILATPGAAAQTRTRLGLSGRELARILHVTPNTLSRWETGKVRPTGPSGLAYLRFLAEAEQRLEAAGH